VSLLKLFIESNHFFELHFGKFYHCSNGRIISAAVAARRLQKANVPVGQLPEFFIQFRQNFRMCLFYFIVCMSGSQILSATILIRAIVAWGLAAEFVADVFAVFAVRWQSVFGDHSGFTDDRDDQNQKRKHKNLLHIG